MGRRAALLLALLLAPRGGGDLEGPMRGAGLRPASAAVRTEEELAALAALYSTPYPYPSFGLEAQLANCTSTSRLSKGVSIFTVLDKHYAATLPRWLAHMTELVGEKADLVVVALDPETATTAAVGQACILLYTAEVLSVPLSDAVYTKVDDYGTGMRRLLGRKRRAWADYSDYSPYSPPTDYAASSTSTTSPSPPLPQPPRPPHPPLPQRHLPALTGGAKFDTAAALLRRETHRRDPSPSLTPARCRSAQAGQEDCVL